jgi:hypothetical protein
MEIESNSPALSTSTGKGWLAPEQSFLARLRDVSITAIATVIGAALALVGVYFSGWFAYASKDEELRYHLVEVALGILRVDPMEKAESLKPVRVWAIKLIARDSGIEFPPGAEDALANNPLATVSGPSPDQIYSGVSEARCSQMAQEFGAHSHWVAQGGDCVITR